MVTTVNCRYTYNININKGTTFPTEVLFNPAQWGDLGGYSIAGAPHWGEVKSPSNPIRFHLTTMISPRPSGVTPRLNGPQKSESLTLAVCHGHSVARDGSVLGCTERCREFRQTSRTRSNHTVLSGEHIPLLLRENSSPRTRQQQHTRRE